MAKTFGDFLQIEEKSGVESLNLSFNPSSIPLKQRWRNNGLSADFMGDYVTTFYPKDENDPNAEFRQEDIRSSMSYVANELLENAMKYTPENSHEMIAISVYLLPDKIVTMGVNEASLKQYEKLKEVIEELTNNDLAELFVQRMEQDALGETSSGLGLITMANDYGAQIAWEIKPTDHDHVVVSTQITLEI